MIAVLLPGLHGNGRLFGPFGKLLSGYCTCRTIDYPANELLSFTELAGLVKSKLPPEEDYFIVAESFSGPIAYQISLGKPRNLKFLVFGASFIDNPNKMLLNSRFLIPYIFKLSTFLPKNLFNLALMGGLGTPELVTDIKSILRDFPRNQFRHRLNLLSRLSLPFDKSEYSAIYIRPLSDYLVTTAGFHSVAERFSDVTKFEVKGTHFIFQSNPSECANIILGAAKEF